MTKHSLIHFSLEALSTRSPLIQSSNQVSSASLRILPRQILKSPSSSSIIRRSTLPPHPSHLLHNDSLLLRFSIPDSLGSSQQFSLSLRPTLNLIHPDAKLHIHSIDPHSGTTSRTTLPLRSEHVLAYSGWVIHEAHVEEWWAEEHASVVRPPDWASSYNDHRVLGWARILVHDTTNMMHSHHLEQLIWEGSFEVDHSLWHVKPFDAFLRTKASGDMHPVIISSHARGGLVAWREADVRHPAHPHSVSNPSSSPPQPSPGLQPLTSLMTCGHDQLSFNIDPNHSIYHSSTPPIEDARPQFGLSSPIPSAFSLPSMSTLAESIFGLPLYRQPDSPWSGYHHPPSSNPSAQRNLVKRQSMTSDISGLGNMTSSNFVNSIGLTTGCPVGAKVAFIGVAADCTYVSKHGSQDAARTAILNNVNSASGLYLKTFNVSLGVVELNVQAATCPAQASQDVPWNVGCPESGCQGLDLNQRLSVFSQWRGNKGGSDGAGLWHLMTNCSTGTEVGVAWLGQLCQVSAVPGSSGQVTSGTGVTAAASTNEWAVMAHEIGHK